MADGAVGQVESEPQPKKLKTLLIVVVVAFVAAALAGGGAYFYASQASDDDSAAQADAKGKGKNAKAKLEKPKGPAIYVEFDPPFVVNFESRGTTRFLQVSVKAMTRDQPTADLLKQHDPVIRNDLLMLLSSQSQDRLSAREGKETLRQEALGVVAKIIANEGGTAKNVEQLYFTSFVMQ